MTVMVFLKESPLAAAAEEIEIDDLLNITKKVGVEKARSLNIKDLVTYAASRVMKRPEEIILRSKPICKGA